MHFIVTLLHILACFILIIVVLLQAGRGANMGAAFGGASQTVFGSSGPGGFLSKLTTIVAAVFMLTSLSLSYFAATRSPSLMDNLSRPVPGKATVPVIPPKPIQPKGGNLPPGEKK